MKASENWPEKVQKATNHHAAPRSYLGPCRNLVFPFLQWRKWGGVLALSVGLACSMQEALTLLRKRAA